MNENTIRYKINQIDKKRIYGRVAENGTAGTENRDGPLALFWGTSGIEFSVKTQEVWALVEADYDTSEPWLSLKINGAFISRQPVLKGKNWICLMRNKNPENQNTILLQKDTQPMSGEARHCLLIHEIALAEGGQFCDVPAKSMKLEFIGDSITSGEGLYGSASDMDWIPQNFGATKAYTVQVAEKLNASYSVLSQCGWGICWGWDGNLNSKLPPHYDNVCSVMWGENQVQFGAKEKYNFEKAAKIDGCVDFVIVNLGTNDNGAFFQPAWKDEKGIEHKLSVDESGMAKKADGDLVAAGVYDFLKNIRNKNPDAKIIWVWGMIKLNAIPKYICSAVEKFKTDTGDKNVYTLELDAMEDVETCEADKGSRGHPGPKTHRLAAEKILNLIQSINS